MPIAKDYLKESEKYAPTTDALSLIQTFPGLPPSGRNGSFLGEKVTNLGDVNADGYDDWALGLKEAAIHRTGCKVYAGSAIAVGVEDKENGIPGRYHLFQNYPNPFNPTTNIRFSLLQREHVTLKIFDLLGKEAATLVEEDLAPGEYSVVFDGNGLSSGVYLYHFKAGAFVEQKKLVLLR